MQQANNLKDYIQALDGAMSPDQCREIINRFEAATPQEHRTDLYSFDQIICNLTPGFEEIAQQYAELALYGATQYFHSLNLPIIPKIEGFEHVRIKRYQPGRDQFSQHVDVADYASARRFLVCMTYLDSNEAGETTFDSLDTRIECVQGRMAIFPPLWMFPHAGRAPAGKPKYTICTLLHYI